MPDEQPNPGEAVLVNELEFISSKDLIAELSRRSDSMVIFSRMRVAGSKHKCVALSHGDKFVCLTMAEILTDMIRDDVYKIFDKDDDEDDDD